MRKPQKNCGIEARKPTLNKQNNSVIKSWNKWIPKNHTIIESQNN